MRQRSVYSIECLCGRRIETEQIELECPACGRKLRVEWDAETQATRPKLMARIKPSAELESVTER